MTGHIVGIDPGLTGAIVAMTPEGELVYISDMPHGDGRVDTSAVGDILRGVNPAVVVVETVHSMPKQGVASSFKFGRSLGAVEGVIGALSYPHVKMTPQAWKKEMSLIGKDKTASRALAKELWPKQAEHFQLVKHDGRADAALIAEAHRRISK